MILDSEHLSECQAFMGQVAIETLVINVLVRGGPRIADFLNQDSCMKGGACPAAVPDFSEDHDLPG
jgi:hypothetical protein